MTAKTLTLYHAPNTRSTGVRILLDELDAPHVLHPLNFKKGEQRSPAYLAINPMGKVPAVTYGDALVTEQVAVYMFLGDLFPAKGLAPQIHDDLRGPYLRWIAYYGSCFEPAMTDRALKREPGRPSMVPYGDFETMLATLVTQLGKGDYILGKRFTVADLLWGLSLNWMLKFELVPATPVLRDYAARVAARPSMARVGALDAALAASQEG